MRSRLPLYLLGSLLLIGLAFGLWAWWFLPTPFRDTAQRVASTRPLSEAIEASKLTETSIPLVPDLSTRTGDDWPSFLGLHGDGTSAEEVKPPKTFAVRWHTVMGEGFAAPAVVRGRILLFDRIGSQNRCRCLKSETGEPLWQFQYATSYQDKQWSDHGPRSSPVSDGKRVYLYGPEGMLHCLRLSDGALLWKCDTLPTFGVVQNIFGVGSTPLLHGDLLLVQVGGSPAGSTDKDFMTLATSGSAIVAFEKGNGTVRYQTGAELASYASPQVVEVDGQPVGLLLARGGLLGFDPQAGVQRFHLPYRSRSYNSVNASNLLVRGKEVFVTESYEVGSALYEIQHGGLKQKWTATPRDKKRGVACHWSTPVRVGDLVFGCASRHRNEAELRCLDWATGKMHWIAKPQLNGEVASRGSLITTGNGLLYYWTEEGWLFVLRANAEKYEQLAAWDATAAVKTLKEPCWTNPVLARRLLYLRGKGVMVCVEGQ